MAINHQDHPLLADSMHQHLKQSVSMRAALDMPACCARRGVRPTDIVGTANAVLRRLFNSLISSKMKG
jgi:hypothetical protein